MAFKGGYEGNSSGGRKAGDTRSGGAGANGGGKGNGGAVRAGAYEYDAPIGPTPSGAPLPSHTLNPGGQGEVYGNDLVGPGLPGAPGYDDNGVPLPGAKVQDGTQRNTTFGKPVSPVRQPGSAPYVGSPSIGQILGTTLGALMGLVAPGVGMINSAPDLINGDINAAPTGGMIGAGIDSLTGSVPGEVTGYDTGFGERTTRDTGSNSLTGANSNRRGIVNDEKESPLGQTLKTVTSAPGVWPPKPKSLSFV